VTSEYGMASFDILIGDHLADTRTYPIGPVFLRLYVDGEPVQTDLKGPDGEEVLVVEAGKELRGFEVWLVNAQDRPVASMTSPQTLALVLAKNTNKPKSYRFRAGKTKISGINAAKQVDRNYSLDFYVPALKDHPMAPHLGIILRTAPGTQALAHFHSCAPQASRFSWRDHTVCGMCARANAECAFIG
jgi:hypothetical protein